MKSTEEKILDEIGEDFINYLQNSAVDFHSFSKPIDPNLNVEDIERLLRIHFVLTESDGGEVGVIDFVQELPERVRRIKTTVTKSTRKFKGEVRGRIDWQETIKERYKTNPKDQTLFACSQTKKNYNIQENLVLKQLLSVIHRTIFEDLKPALETPSEYEWLKDWTEEEDNLRNTLEKIFHGNVYLNRIDTDGANVTDRMINSVKKSRSQLYKEAAQLLEKYRKLMKYDIEPSEAKELLKNTFIKPDKTDVLFELYWVIQIIKNYENPKFNIIEPKNNIVAEWEDSNYKYRIYHDSTGSESLKFREELNERTKINEDGYLYRQREIASKWNELRKNIVGRTGSDNLWGGRPDILLEKYNKKTKELKELFIGEVKYTRDQEYALRGLKELLEYMALVKKGNQYLENQENILESNQVKGMLFTDKIGEEMETQDPIRIVKFGMSPDIVL